MPTANVAATNAVIRAADTSSADRPDASALIRAHVWIRGPTNINASAATSSTGTTRVGNVMSGPDPTTALMAPAPTPARAIRIISTTGTAPTYRSESGAVSDAQ